MWTSLAKFALCVARRFARLKDPGLSLLMAAGPTGEGGERSYEGPIVL